ncbi:hypothetical protein [Aquimarina sp. 2201CG5-10]|uniref:hypothetical protein n=1 Tax=Aquimarina callyspongiae TaxID=3098150 RepID=UPI002AB4EEDE|nr:hypothetical protein [Aquimarina sp. 2201CG5-10]MDY8137317.1 hypothetical protein [Aquimarina sp. 2201CG5-10]
MKSSFFKTFAIAITLGVALVACEDREEDLQEEQAQEINDTPTKNAVFPTEVSDISFEVAKIQKNGHEYQFIAVGENDDMVVIEKLYGTAEKNNETSNLEKDQTPFDIFVSLTNKNILVPERIAKTAEGAALQTSGRTIEKSERLLEILDPNYVESIQQRACYDVGSTNFRNTYCGGTPVVSTPTDIRFCDNGLWYSNTRNSYYGGSWRERDDVQTWTNVKCGMTRLQFYAWKSSGIWPFNTYSWHLQYQVDFTNGIWYANYYTSDYTEREVRRTRPTNSGSFRAYTRFF